ncbi:MAG TPA: O-antigen ligase family protein [Chloroflexota bacterium]|nr:O-antigen ligase family protein [Chloroflexota bacterium]
MIATRGEILTTPAGRWTARRAVLLLAALAALASIWVLPPTYLAAALVGLGLMALTLIVPVAGLCILAFAVPWGSTVTVTAGSFPISPVEIVSAGLAGALAFQLAEDRENVLREAPWTPYVALFLIAISLSASQAIDLHASERELVKWLEMLVVYLAAVRFLRGDRNLQIVVAAIVLAGVSQALLGYVQFALNLGPAAFAAQRAFLRAYGTFDQPNPYAGYLNIVAPFALAMALRAPSAAVRRWYWLAFLALAGAVLASESRGALLAGTAGLLLMLAILYRRVAVALALGALAGIGGALCIAYGVVPLGPLDRLLTAVGLGQVSFQSVNDANFSAVERAAHWLAGVRMFAAHPLLGVGIGNYAAAYPAFHPRGWYASLEHAHNYYINIAAEAGIFGLAAYVLLVGSALWYSYASARGVPSRVKSAASLGVIGALAATSLHNVFDVLYVHGTAALLGLIVAFVAAGNSGQIRTRNTRPDGMGQPAGVASGA